MNETCEVCGKTGKAAKACAFGHAKGPCSCWGNRETGYRQVPCTRKR